MAVTLNSAEAALKDVYLGVVANQLNTSANPLLAEIKQTTAGIWGKDIIKAAPYGINGGVGAGSEDGALPIAGGNNYVQFKTSLKNLYGKIEISDKAIRISENNAGAFVNFLNDEMEGLLKASSFNLGRMLYGNGSGLLATTTKEAASGNALEVDDARNFIEGMIVDIYNGDAPVVTGKRVSFVDRTKGASKIYFDSAFAVTVPSGATLYVQGSKDFEITGIEALFGDGTIYGLDRTQYQWLNPYHNSESKEISDILMQETIDALEDKAGSNVNFISCARDVRRAYQKYLTYYKRNVDVTTLAGGQKAITFNGIPVVADRFVEDGTMYFLNTEDFVMHQLGDWNWLEGEDGKVLRNVNGFPLYTATLCKYADIVCSRPIGQAKLSNISSTVTNPYADILAVTTGE